MTARPERGETHTPTPWRVNRNDPERIESKDYGGIAVIIGTLADLHPEREANARLIVRAVNTHADLIDALRQFVARCEILNEGGSGEFVSAPPKSLVLHARAVLERATTGDTNEQR